MKSVWILLLLAVLSVGCISEEPTVQTAEPVDTTSPPIITTMAPQMIVPRPTLPTTPSTTVPTPTPVPINETPVETPVSPETSAPPSTTMPPTTASVTETPVETTVAPQTTAPPTTPPPTTDPPPVVPPTTSPPTTTPPPTPSTMFTGLVVDCQYPYGTLTGISSAAVSYEDTSNTTSETGQFSLSLATQDTDPLLEVSATGYVSYSERPSRIVEGAFHLIPDSIYQGLYSLLWDNSSNPQNWHRRWDQQTEFVIVQTNASQQELTNLQTILVTDEYRKMTGGRFTSAVQPTLVDSSPTGSDKNGKTIISFASGVDAGGVASSVDDDQDGVIDYAEITYDVNQVIDANVLWHSMVHTVTASGHISQWSSIVSEGGSVANVTENDEKVFNCIYNSPPKRADPTT